MRVASFLVIAGCSAWLFAGCVRADGLSVSPTGLSVTGGGKVAALSVKASGKQPTAGQIRVLRWLQQGGKEQLVPTRDVVASPPALRLDPGREMTVRIVRTVDTTVTGEECYRVLVDQLPGSEQDGVAVKFAIRHSIPLCFDAPKQAAGEVTWSLGHAGKGLVLSGANSGQRRVVAKDVKIAGAGGAKASLGAAVVLGGSTMSWPLKGALKAFAPGADFTLSATINGKDVQFKGKVGGG